MERSELHILIVCWLIVLAGGWVMTWGPSPDYDYFYLGVGVSSLGVMAFLGEAVDVLARRLNDVQAALERSQP